MEEFSVSLPEYKILVKYQRRLEQCFDVVICLPDINYGVPPASINMQVIGESRNITYIKKFLEREMNSPTMRKKGPAKAVKSRDSVPVIILNDDEDDSPKPQKISPLREKNSGPPNSESTSSSTATKNPASSSPCKGQGNLQNSPSNHQNADDSIVIVLEESSLWKDQSNLQSSPSNHQNFDDSIVILSEASSSPRKGQGNLQCSPRNHQNADDSIVIVSEVIVSSTSVAVMGKKSPSVQKETAPSSVNNPVAECNKFSPPLPDFIPLRVRNCQPQLPKKCGKRKLEASAGPVVKKTRVLRPIVIDGSNVARQHGQHSNTFSCKGIQICVDYFLQRGHTDIKVLLPHFRKYITNGHCITTNPEYLDVLEARNMVVFTPSRKVNERRITCYDDRFIVSLAAQTNGVIVSNDQFRDILEENAEFKKTITERLLMFCIAGDIFMIPEDPLGPKGPSLDHFLSMEA